jgi:hypothetical protein
MMHLVLDAPITSDALSKGVCTVQIRGNIVASFGFLAELSAIVELALTLHSNQRLEPWPGFDVIKGSAEADDSFFHASMTFAELGVARLSDKMGLDRFVQESLIAFEGT